MGSRVTLEVHAARLYEGFVSHVAIVAQVEEVPQQNLRGPLEIGP